MIVRCVVVERESVRLIERLLRKTIVWCRMVYAGTLRKISGFGISCKFFKIIWSVRQVRFHRFPWCRWNPDFGDNSRFAEIGLPILAINSRFAKIGLPILAIRTDLNLRHDLLVKKQHASETETVTNTYTGYSFFHSQKLTEAQNSQQVKYTTETWNSVFSRVKVGSLIISSPPFFHRL